MYGLIVAADRRRTSVPAVVVPVADIRLPGPERVEDLRVHIHNDMVYIDAHEVFDLSLVLPAGNLLFQHF